MLCEEEGRRFTTQFDMTTRDADDEINVQSQGDSNVTAPASGHHDVGIGEDVPVDEPHFEADDTETVERSEVDDDWAETTSIPEDEVVARLELSRLNKLLEF